MQKLKFIQQDPTVSSYKIRISAEEWSHYENIVRDWHSMGKTRSETLSVLNKHFSFRPSLAQLNAQMTVWGLKTYKKKKNGGFYEHLQHRKFYIRREGVRKDTNEGVNQFLLGFIANLRAMVRDYESKLQLDRARFIHLLWRSMSPNENVEAFLDHHRPGHSSVAWDHLKTLDCIGDFFLAGRALKDAFDAYSRILYVRLNLMDQAVSLPDLYLAPIIDCAESAESTEQKKLAFELLEHCLLYHSITGRYLDTMSVSLRKHYTSKDQSQEIHIPTVIRDSLNAETFRFDWISSTLKTIDTTIIHTCIIADECSGLDLPIQHAIYAHLWRKSLVDQRIEFLHDTDLMSLLPSRQRCELFAAIAHILAEDVVKNHLRKLLDFHKHGFSLALSDFFRSYRINESHTRTGLIKAFRNPSYDNFKKREADSSVFQAQCSEWLKGLALKCLDTNPRLNTRSNAANSSVSTEIEEKIGDLQSVLLDSGHRTDIEMTEETIEALRSSILKEESSVMTQSVYLCSSSMPSSMNSMLSMSSRIERNARSSAVLSLSQLSNISITMRISGSSSFGRVTGMGSGILPSQSMDYTMGEAGTTFEQDLLHLPMSFNDARLNAENYHQYWHATILEDEPRADAVQFA